MIVEECQVSQRVEGSMYQKVHHQPIHQKIKIKREIGLETKKNKNVTKHQLIKIDMSIEIKIGIEISQMKK